MMFDCVVAFLDAHSTAVTATATAFIAIFTLVLAFVAIAQGRLMRRSIAEAKRSADAALLTAEATIASERGYVTMSHHPPGLNINQSNGIVTADIKIENAGRSPATVTKIVLKLDGFPLTEQLAADPDYDSGQVQTDLTETSLAAGGSVNKPLTFNWNGGDLNTIQRGQGQMWLYGYVDYTDIFGERRRSGYGRVYGPAREKGPINFRNNLPLIPQSGYNYDCPAKEE